MSLADNAFLKKDALAAEAREARNEAARAARQAAKESALLPRGAALTLPLKRGAPDTVPEGEAFLADDDSMAAAFTKAAEQVLRGEQPRTPAMVDRHELGARMLTRLGLLTSDFNDLDSLDDVF